VKLKLGFGNVNKNLDAYLKRLMSNEGFDLEKYGKILHKVYKYANKIIESGDKYLLEREDIVFSKTITKEETLRYVKDFLRKIDSSFVIKFEEALENGVFHFTDKDTLLEENDLNYYYKNNLAGVVDDKYFTNIVMTYTISDAFLILHEFMHYCNLLNLKEMTSGWAMFTEGYSNFFEFLFLEYFSEFEEIREDALNYFYSLLYSIVNRTSHFVSQYFVFDVFLCHGKIEYKKIYKYCSDYEDPIRLFYCILGMIEEVDEYFSSFNPKLSEYLDDARYIIGIPFTLELLENFETRKQEILEDYMILNSTNMDYYLDKYELEKHENYDKVFCLNK